MLGYPLNLNYFPKGKCLNCLDFILNNLGDPFIGSAYGLNTFGYEKEVIYWFADLLNLSKDQTWGYMTSCGSEANLRGLLLGRERFPNATIYYTDKAHYSVAKAARMLGGESVVLATDKFHGLDLSSLDNLDFNKSAILCLTAGTTMGGAVDQISQAIDIALTITNLKVHVHIDAALSGLILPFLPLSPSFDFCLSGVGSVAVSGHKQLGVPIPCGVFLARKVLVESSKVEYLGSEDGPLFGSRSGFATLLLWLAIQYYGREGLDRMAEECMGVVKFAEGLLKGIDWPYWRNLHSTTIVLHRPPEEVCRKWQLAVEGDEAHIIIMPHVTEQMITNFVSDLKSYSKKGSPSCESICSPC